MTAEIQRDLGRQEAAIEAMQHDMAEMKRDLREMKEAFQQVKGGSRVLIGLSALLGGAMTTLMSWVLTYIEIRAK